MNNPIRTINDIIHTAMISQLDISRDYFRKAPRIIHELQSRLIRATRDVYMEYTSFFGHSEDENKKSLYTLAHVHKLKTSF